MSANKVLINGEWRNASFEAVFSPFSPQDGKQLTSEYPVSNWADCDDALNAAIKAHQALSCVSRQTIAKFLDGYANRITASCDRLVELAHQETGLAKSPRLADVEIPRTVSQIKLAAEAARTASWSHPIIDSTSNIRSMLQSIGPVAVFGPNNFPFAFGSISGSDFASAIAAGNPVIAKAHPSHPGTTKLFAELAQQAAEECELPKGTVQLIYAMSNDSGLKLVSDPRIAATGFTGSRPAGLALKKAAEDAGKLIYLELSSLNPVFVLQGALQERLVQIADEYVISCTMAAGQLCTKPGLIIVPKGDKGDQFVSMVKDKFESGPVAPLLSEGAAKNIKTIADKIMSAGATLLTSNTNEHSGFRCNNTLLSINGSDFLRNSEIFQLEMFGNASLIIRSGSTEESQCIIANLEGNLTGCFYTDTNGSDDDEYQQLEPFLRPKVGRIINDKMPTGVAVSLAMNHGGPFPASGHPGFTAVGMPSSIKRFSALKCFDNVRENRLPDVLANKNPSPHTWRQIDGKWTTEDVSN